MSHELDHVLRRCSDGDPHGEFPHPLAHAVGDHAVQANGRQCQREHAERAEYSNQEVPRPHFRIEVKEPRLEPYGSPARESIADRLTQRPRSRRIELGGSDRELPTTRGWPWLPGDVNGAL